jgi:ATP-dependent RNA helicase HelY
MPIRDGPDDDPADSVAVSVPSARDLPIAACPDLDRHLSAAAERDRLRSQIDDVDRRLQEKSSSLTRQFDRIHTLLGRWGFVQDWALTERGEVLARVFHETDLLCASVICEGLLDDLGPAALAGVVSTLTYEHRSKEPPPPPWYPSKEVRERATKIDRLARKLGNDEMKVGLSASRLPDPSFLALAYAWAAGESFDVVIADEDLSGGDFVRNIKTLIDLLRQVGEVAPQPATRASARQAADALFRGIISASSEVGSAAPGPGTIAVGP